MNALAVGVVKVNATNDMKKANRLSFINTKSGDHKSIPKTKITPKKMVDNKITIDEVVSIEYLFFRGKKRIMDWSRPRNDIMAIKPTAEIKAVFKPTSCWLYILAAIIQKIKPNTAPETRVKSI
jgi:hypothetical protein